jgi:Rv2525c-like, glycoside hydrolase-like domain
VGRQRAPGFRESVRCRQKECPACGLAASHKPGRLAYGRDGQSLAQQRSWILGSLIRSGPGQCELRRGLARAWRAIGVAMAVTGVLLPAVNAGTKAAAAADTGFRSVTYQGYSFQVPGSWRVINLAHHWRTCVRFDRHTVYLGTPSHNQACPSRIFGTTEAMLIEPASRNAARISVWNPVARQVTVVTHRIRIAATFDTNRKQIDRILASAGLSHPVKDAPKVQPAPWLPLGVTNYQGPGFDTCAAPSKAVMHTWSVRSPYAAIGIYLGGSDAACSQPNLTSAWLSDEAAQGWHFIPLYVGPQAAFGELSRNSSAIQGVAAATDAAGRAQQLGFAPTSPIYYDMEGYPPGQSTRVLRFLSAWTTTLHALKYSSGVYSSSSSGIADLARQYGRGVYAMPDVIYDALWNGQANTFDPVFSPGQWAFRHRLHQYAGNVTQTFGGVTINIDQDFMNVRLAVPLRTYRAVVPGLLVRNAPHASAAIADVLGAVGSRVAVNCYTLGSSVSGDSVWYHLVAPHAGYAAGFYLNTGHDPAHGIPQC